MPAENARGRVLRLMERLTRADSLWLPGVVIAANFLLSLHAALVTLDRFPNSGDEYAYLISAELMSQGRLSAPSPELPEFFNVVHVVNDGKFYGKYPPGWPLLLAAGFWMGAPWLINPILGALATFTLWKLLARAFNQGTANLALVALLGNPYFILNSASYFSHPACLLFGTLSLFLALRCVENPDDRSSWIALGASAGACFLIRPFTAVVLLGIPAAWLLWKTLSSTPRALGLKRLGFAFAPFSALLLCFLLYNHAQTGHALVQPFQRYDPTDTLSLPQGAEEWSKRVTSHVSMRLLQLARWLPFAPLFLFAAPFVGDIRRDPRARLLLGAVALVFVAHFFYWGDGIIQYGPRYLFEASGAMLAIMALIVARLRSRALPVLLLILGVNVGTLITESGRIRDDILGKQDVARVVQEAGLEDAVVFLKTGSGKAPAWDCARNGLDFHRSVLLVRDLGARNTEFFSVYENRSAFVYQYDHAKKQGRLTPLDSRP